MSRHRDVRNLHKEDYDYDEYETEEAEYSDDEMDMAVAKVVSLIGNYNESEIKSSLIYYQMDIQRTANYLKSKQPPFGFHYLENMEKGNEIQLKQQSQTDLLSLKSLSLNPENQKPPLSNPSLDLKSLCKPSSNIPDLKSLSNQPKVDLKSLSKPGIDLKSLSASGFGLKKSDSPVNGLKSLGNLSMQINLSSLTSNPLNNDLPHSISSEPSKTVTFNNQSFHSKTPNFFAKPSDFAVCLCEDDYQFNSSLFIPNFFDSNYSYSAQAAKNKVKLFDFKSPSPDDIISNARSNKKDGDKNHKHEISTPKLDTKPIKKPKPQMTQAEMDVSALNLNSPLAPSVKTAQSNSNSSKQKKINVLEEYAKRDLIKPSLNVIVIGHVDAGKSTLMGHLLYILGEVEEKTMRKFERDAQKIGKGSFMYAWVLDENQEERERGVTIDIAVTKFETTNRKFTLMDAPGHRDFVPRVISGASQADIGILVVSANIGEFESGFHLEGQTKEHAILARSLGVNQLVIAINKMDMINWSEDRFNEIQTELVTFLTKQAGFKKSNISCIPCSGLSGENLVKRSDSELATWYTGPTLTEQLDLVDIPTRHLDRPLRFPITDICKGGTIGISSSGSVTISGKIDQGYIQTGDEVLILPLNEKCLIKSVVVQNDEIGWAVAGDYASLVITGVDIDHLSIGNVVCDIKNPIPLIKQFTSQILTFDLKIPILPGHTLLLYHHSMSIPVKIIKLIGLLDKTNLKILKSNPRCIPKNSCATVCIQVITEGISGSLHTGESIYSNMNLHGANNGNVNVVDNNLSSELSEGNISIHQRGICMELFKTSSELGRFMLRDQGRTIAAGLVTEIIN